jgi:hypothetical protein
VEQKQRCPVCSAEVSDSTRYPRYVCPICANKTRAADGRRVEFFNESLSGGFVGRYSDNSEAYDNPGCFLGDIRCYADEARFGGIVIQVKS